MKQEFDFRKQFYDACLAADIKVISGEKCCQLLAWVSVYGGGHEQCVIDERLRNAILYAQQRLNIIGGEVPCKELTPIMVSYIKSISDYDNPPDWVFKLEKEYTIKAYRKNK